MPGHRRLDAEGRQQPGPGRAGVGQRLLRGEGLGRDDEQGLGGIEIVHGLGEVAAVDVGDEAERELAVGIVPQRRGGHHRPQVRATDADVDDAANPLARVTEPFAPAHPLAEGRHPVEHLVHAGHHVRPVEDDRLGPRGPQRHVQHRAILGGVDPRAREHRVDPVAEPARLREPHEQRQRAVGEPLLGVVREQAAGLEGEPLGAVVVRREEFPQREVTGSAGVLGDGPPLGERCAARWSRRRCHACRTPRRGRCWRGAG